MGGATLSRSPFRSVYKLPRGALAYALISAKKTVFVLFGETRRDSTKNRARYTLNKTVKDSLARKYLLTGRP